MVDMRSLSPAYAGRLNKALDHLDRHSTRRVSLEELAQVSGFAPFHFHRVFKSAFGQTPHEYGLRRRVYRAAFMLEHGDRRRTLTEIAHELGFSESSDFSRAFKAQFGVSPSEFRKQPRRVSGPRPWKTLPRELVDNEDGFEAVIAREAAMPVAYVRVHDPYGSWERGLAALHDLHAWARQHAIAEQMIGASQDDPEITPRERCRYDWLLPINGSPPLRPPIRRRVLPACLVARVRVAGDLAKCERVWEWLFRVWLPSSGYEPADSPAREHYLDGGRSIPRWFDLTCVVPIRALKS
jgi:AraC family transcriptional regulator